MANFNTHLLGGAVVSGVLSSTLLFTGLFSPAQGMVLWGAGTLGGLLPDLDADNSALLKGLFSALGIFASFVALFSFLHLPLLYVWGLMLGAFLIVRFGIMGIFTHLTTHRGAFHSLLAAGCMGLGTAYLGWRLASQGIDYAWATGGMVFAGYLTHLILDECFAVNLEDMEFKQSFGSALKPFSLKSGWASGIFLALALFFAWMLPIPQRLEQTLMSLSKSQLSWEFVYSRAGGRH